MADCREDALILPHGPFVTGERLLEFVEAVPQNHRPRVRGDGKPPLEIMQQKAAVLESQNELLILEHFAELIAQNGEQHLVIEIVLERLPVDVEKL